jgi:hypothetical protein
MGQHDSQTTTTTTTETISTLTQDLVSIAKWASMTARFDDNSNNSLTISILRF